MANQASKKKQAPSIKVELTITRKTFETDDGRTVNYFEQKMELAGQEITMQPKDTDKKLQTYLLNKEFDALEDDSEDDSEDVPF